MNIIRKINLITIFDVNYEVVLSKFFEFDLVSAGKVVLNAESNRILSHLTQLLPTKKVTKSPKNRHPTCVECH